MLQEKQFLIEIQVMSLNRSIIKHQAIDSNACYDVLGKSVDFEPGMK